LIGITLEVVLDKAFWQRVATPDNPNMNFQIQHISTLAKYAGISFIAGAVNHGMFSENRSYATAAVGVLFFLVGSFIEKQASIHGAKSWGDLLGFGIVASIGLGFFTGGLQHFPDSPDRSIWVVPLGFFLSLIALYMTEGKENISWRSFVIYGLVAGAVVVLGSVAFARYMLTLDPAHDGHGHSHSHASSPAVQTPQGRVVEIAMDDQMRFVPDQVTVTAGESIQFVVTNLGKVRHEMVVGTPDELEAHAKEMQSTKAHHHHSGNAVSVEPGGRAVLSMTFPSAGQWAMACFEPGHYPAGMKGVVRVEPK